MFEEIRNAGLEAYAAGQSLQDNPYDYSIQRNAFAEWSLGWWDGYEISYPDSKI